MVEPTNLLIPGLPYFLLALGIFAVVAVFAVVLNKFGNARELIEQGGTARPNRERL